MLERIDLERLAETGDVLETLRELKLDATDAILVYTAEVLVRKLNASTSPSGSAQIAAQLVNIHRELKASAGGSIDPLMESFRR